MATNHIELQGQKRSTRETLQHQMTLAVDLKRKNVIRGESFVLPGSQSQETLQNPWVEDKAQHERVAAL